MKSVTIYKRSLGTISVTWLIVDQQSLSYRKEQKHYCVGFPVSCKSPPSQIIWNWEARIIPHPLSFCCLLSRFSFPPPPCSTQPRGWMSCKS